MNKKLIISIVAIAIMIVGATSAFAATEGNAPSLEDKLEAIEARVDEGSMTRDEADAIIAEITECDEDCEDGEVCTDRPEEGRGIFGNGAMDGNGFKGGNRNNQNDSSNGTGTGQGRGQGKGRGQNRNVNDCLVDDAA